MTEPIILADGVFDPLHDGHVRYLSMAAQVDLSARLVVQVSPQRKRVECLPWVTRALVVVGARRRGRGDEVRHDARGPGGSRARATTSRAWTGRGAGVPADEQAACDRLGVTVRYVDTYDTRSSTALLRAWADLEAHRGVREFDADARVQQVVSVRRGGAGLRRTTATGWRSRRGTRTSWRSSATARRCSTWAAGRGTSCRCCGSGAS